MKTRPALLHFLTSNTMIMSYFFSPKHVICAFLLVPFFSASLIAQSSSFPNSQMVTQATVSATDVGAPILACSTMIPKGGKVIAEYFLTSYENAYTRVAMFKAYGFEHAALMHTDCQAVDVNGDFYFVVVSPVETDEALLYKMMEPLNRKARKEGLKFGKLRIVRNQE